MSDAVIEAEGLTKRFGRVEALAGLDLVARSGEVTAVLGPNGAGKTTFVRSVATLVRPDGGSLTVSGVDALRHPHQVRRFIGLAGQYAAVEPAMTGRENLVMVGRLFGHDRRTAARNAALVLEEVDLVDAADRLVRTYSGGMRRRLDLGASLVGGPRLLLLDEPTTGLDPRSRNQLWEAIRQLVAGGTDVLLTTQYLDEADQLAHKVAIIDKGRVIAQGTPGELKAQVGRDMIEVHTHERAGLDRLAQALSHLGAEEPRVDVATNRVTIPVDDGRAAIARAVRALDDVEVEIDDIGVRRPTLDEVFLTLTGEPIAGEPAVNGDGAAAGGSAPGHGADRADRADQPRHDHDGAAAPGAA
jgi:ABC-2 type transport system ATP-binding protein